MPDSSLFRVSGSRHIHRGLDEAHLFAQPHTRRISQFNGLNFSTGSSISPLRAAAILANTLSDFHEVSRAVGRPMNQGGRQPERRSLHGYALLQLL